MSDMLDVLADRLGEITHCPVAVDRILSVISVSRSIGGVPKEVLVLKLKDEYLHIIEPYREPTIFLSLDDFETALAELWEKIIAD